MTDLIDTTEMYLRTVFELEEEGIVALRARIAERLGHSGPTVSQTVARMERDNLLIVTDDRHLEFTNQGRARATEVMRKHRLAERLLTDIIGLEWEYLHDEACRWEHVMSERVEQRLLELLGHPTESPYGTPIPGLSGLGERSVAEAFLDGVISLADVDLASGMEVTIRRIGEPAQVGIELLARLSQVGVRPGQVVQAKRAGDIVTISIPDAPTVLDLPEEVARHIFVIEETGMSIKSAV